MRRCQPTLGNCVLFGLFSYHLFSIFFLPPCLCLTLTISLNRPHPFNDSPTAQIANMSTSLILRISDRNEPQCYIPCALSQHLCCRQLRQIAIVK
ncbi:hypothetical protein CGRA01v4_02581 [Colletotrichum graminicola]|nr:hypothetical protein CGRA01v4_02581 [Colletotrichum graminicola]